ncbi:MAG: HlyD family secretion protein, partial [Sideroxydans sp.]
MERIKAHKHKIAVILTLTALGGILAFTYLYGRSRSTENAYINADVVNVASLVGGRVVAVHVKENQHVRKGDALFDVDPKPFTIALERAQADLALARQTARQDNAEVTAARAQVEQAESDYANARNTYNRDKELVEQHFLSQQALDDAQTRMQALQASVGQARAKLAKALSAPVKTEERGDVLKAQAAIDQARL